MNLTEVAIRRPLTVWMVVLAAMLMGAIAYTRLPVRRLPHVTFPFVQVVVTDPGASPQDMRTLVTDPLQTALQGVSGIQTMTGISEEGVARIALAFDSSTALATDANGVAQAVDGVARLMPPGASAPSIIQADPNAVPIMDVALGGPLSSAQLYDLATLVVQPALQAVPGVASALVVGGRQPQVHVTVDPAALAAYQVSLPQLEAAIASNNASLPGGTVTHQGQTISVRTRGYFQSLASLERLAVGGRGAQTVRLRQVASVRTGTAPATTIDRLDGRPAVALQVVAQSTANALAVDHAVRAALATLGGHLPEGVQLHVVGDTTISTRQADAAVRTDLVLAVLLAGLVLTLFLHNLRNTAIVLLAIPASLISTFLVMYFLHFSLDDISLMALSLLIGILVDDSIVVLENITRHRRMGKDPSRAAMDGRMEIGGAALAITLTDVVVYAPMGFVSGVVGEVFHEFGLTIVAATLISLLVSFTFTPMLAARWSAPLDMPAGAWLTTFGRAWDRGFARLADGYAHVLHRVLRRRPLVLLLAAGALVASVALVASGAVPTGLVPTGDPGVYDATLTMPVGTSLPVTAQVVDAVAARVRRLRGVTDVFTTVGAGGGFGNLPSTNVGQMTVDLLPKTRRHLPIAATVADTAAMAQDYPGLQMATTIPSAFFGGGVRPVTTVLQGPSLTELQQLAARLVSLERTSPLLRQVQSSALPAAPQWSVQVARSRADYLGVSAQAIGQTVASAVGGLTASEYRAAALPAQEPIVVQLRHGTALTRSEIAAIPVGVAGGQVVPLGEVATVQQGFGPQQIDEQNGMLQVQVNASLAPGVKLGTAARAVAGLVRQLNLPAGYVAVPGGLLLQQRQVFLPLVGAFVLSVLLIYMLMTALYESALQPLAIILSLPLATFGALLGLWVAGLSLDMYALIASIMLMGLVAKNAILLIDYTNTLRGRGLALAEALAESGRARLRPVLMTTATMVMAMLPLVLNNGPGSSTRQPTAVVLIGGLLTSTLLTLLVVPVLYSYLEGIAAWWLRRAGATEAWVSGAASGGR